MRSRASHFACLLLLLSSFAVSDARAGNVTASRTPGGVFVHNLLLRAVVEDLEPALSGFGREDSPAFSMLNTPMPLRAHWVPIPVTRTAHVHAVTGSSL